MTTTNTTKTQIVSIKDFIEKHIRYQQHWNKKVIGMGDAKWQELQEDTWIDGITYAKGSIFKVFETSNFGWIVFRPETRTTSGDIPNKRIIKW